MAKKKKIKKNTKTKKPKKLKKAFIKKPKVDITPKKQTNLNQEDKPEIKKIKKQATAKKEYMKVIQFLLKKLILQKMVI